MQLVVGVAICSDDSGTARVLAARRTHPPELAGSWELPGGKVRPGEDPAAAARREIGEELGCDIEVTGWLGPDVPVGDALTLRVATAVVVGREPVPLEHDIVRWLDADQLLPGDRAAMRWLRADVPFLEQIRAVLRSA